MRIYIVCGASFEAFPAFVWRPFVSEALPSPSMREARLKSTHRTVPKTHCSHPLRPTSRWLRGLSEALGTFSTAAGLSPPLEQKAVSYESLGGVVIGVAAWD